jgi:hypothetical protein
MSRNTVVSGIPDEGVAYVFKHDQVGLSEVDHTLRAIFNPYYYNRSRTIPFIGKASMTVPLKVGKRWPNGQVGKGTLKLVEWHEDSERVTVESSSYSSQVAAVTSSADVWFAASIDLKMPAEDFQSVLHGVFIEYLGTLVIPYDLADRKSKFSGAFAALADQIARLQSGPASQPPQTP